MSLLSITRKQVACLVITVGALGALQAGPAAAQSVGPSVKPPVLHNALPTINGTLVAKPVSGEGNLPSACTDRSANATAATMQNRGLVVCTDSGRLVLVEVTRNTGYYARYWGRIALRHLTDGDRISAWGVLTDGGYILNPTVAIQDTDVQEAAVDSQDLIRTSGPRLSLFVLRSTAGGPVNGLVYAIRGGTVRITLCNGRAGRWADLTTGKTVDITRSLFNRRTNIYVHTGDVHIVSCT